MRKKNNFICPKTKTPLQLVVKQEDNNNNIISGELISENSLKFDIVSGIPNLIYPKILFEEDKNMKKWYEDNADVYDKYLPLTFKTFNENESKIREKLVDLLEIKPNYKILETGAGTGRDSVLIANKLDKTGEFHVHDICYDILEKSFDKLEKYDVLITYCLSNASYLPYPDDYFDAYYHFGGLNTFSEKSKAFSEINRVVKTGGKVVVGDENMPIWLRDTEFGKILMNSNPHYKYELPLKHIHYSSRDVKIKWIIGGVFYCISYVVGEGEPYADLDFEIPGSRGGTHRTRYYGHIEGASNQAVRLAHQARKKSGKSMHKWLDDVIKDAAKKELNKK